MAVVVLTVVMLIMSVSACDVNGGGQTVVKDPNAKFRVAYFKSFNMIAPGLEQNIENMVKLAGGEVVYVQMRVDPDGIINMVEEMIALECDGILLMPTNDSVMVSVAKRCKEAGVYFASLFRRITDPEVLSILEANPYWCGWVVDDDEESAYEIGRMLAEKGYKEVAAINVSVGDAGGDARDRGFSRAAEDFGFKIVAEERQPADAVETTKICESFMAAYPNLDCIVNLSTYVVCGVEAMCSAVVNAGKQDRIKIATCDFYMSQQEYWDSGLIVCGRGGQQVIDNMLCMALVINAVKGTPIDNDGKPVYVTCANVYAQNGDELREWYTYVENKNEVLYAFTDEELKTLLIKEFNPEISSESFQAVASSWGFEFFRNKKAGK